MKWLIILALIYVAWHMGSPWLRREMAKTRAENANDGKLPFWQANTSPKTFNVDVVGESHYKTSLAEVMAGANGAREVEKIAVLIPYVSEHDPNAVRVEIDGMIVGHLSKSDRTRYLSKLKDKFGAHHTASAHALVGGGATTPDGSKGPIGVFLCIPEMG